MLRGLLQRLKPPPPAMPALTLLEQKQKELGADRILPLGNRGTVFLGRWSYYGSRTEFVSFHPNDVLTIGPFCSIADHVQILLSQGHHHPASVSNYPISQFFHQHVHPLTKNYTRIGSDVWIGRNSIILPGIHVGDGAIIAAGSVVTKDVPPYAIVGGNPAQLIKWRVDDPRLREQLPTIGWWEWTDTEIEQRRDFFSLPYADALALAQANGWCKSEDIPTSYWDEIGQLFPLQVLPTAFAQAHREFFYHANNAKLIHQEKPQSYENMALWRAALQHHRPKTIVELGTHTGASSLLIARLCRELGLVTRIISIDTDPTSLVHRDSDVDYVVEDFTGNMAQLWERWNPDILFQDTHRYPLMKEQLEVGMNHPHTIHFFHDVGVRRFKNPMTISLDTVPASGDGLWERHVLGFYASTLLVPSVRHFEDAQMLIHIFDACSDPHEYGMGIVKFNNAH